MSKSTPFQTGSLESDARLVYVVDDDELVRGALSGLLRSIDIDVRAFASTEEFLAADKPAIPSCLVLDVRLRGQSGLALQQTLIDDGRLHMPIIFMTGYGDIAMSVKAMKAGAMDFLAKPFRDQDMIDAVIAALERDARRLASDRSLHAMRTAWESLTPREREVLQLVATGLLNKQIAANMGIAEITAKIHRGQAMRKMNSRSVAELMRKMEALGIVQTPR
ncbi:response regulator transcription factor [Paraburkholderia hospita]|jgi:FixJ family two-component response regulator|uniref:DNA-binding response regulator n=1 Tax=Paraburkholderia hospita TaxID=169430 RepID=A0AAJ5BQV9_9BURK|nr:response regulator [Paraburkholderia hospita]EUC13229.1 two component transcriptional regulator, LuxR family [Burkholderia sp. BT03]SOE86434.1 two component transcriptional regulator, LuxR family [Burkholderia sp. YR290]AUT72047.1 DNA-binding response regulator [Paraburkholderia hospita]AXF02906.1 DNA-binding response regulator [Paraburkholderia hospita]EIM95709.1 two component transcriptional regulator, LuxR family protein [Paraburkholderia hospita]